MIVYENKTNTTDALNVKLKKIIIKSTTAGNTMETGGVHISPMWDRVCCREL